MRIIAVELHHYRLPLRETWVSAAGEFSHRAGCLLRITTDNQRLGYGDCAPLEDFGNESLAAASRALNTFAKMLAGLPVIDALDALPRPSDCNTPAARCAVETALLDILAQANHVPLARYLQGNAVSRAPGMKITTNAALGSLMRVSEQTIRTACADGFSILKLKVGTMALDQELARLRDIAALLPAGTLLRLDANRAWNQADAARFIKACADMPIEMIEEPLADPQTGALRHLQAACTFPLALDESSADFDLEALCSAPPVRRLVLKPPRLGGLLPAWQIAGRAAAAGLQCIVTSSVDSACGVLAAGHLAAALDNGLAHGLATSSWLTADTGTVPTVTRGRLTLPDTPGLGFSANSGLVFSDIARE